MENDCREALPERAPAKRIDEILTHPYVVLKAGQINYEVRRDFLQLATEVKHLRMDLADATRAHPTRAHPTPISESALIEKLKALKPDYGTYGERDAIDQCIAIIHQHTLSGWQDISTCPPEKEVWGFCAYEDTNVCGVSDPNKLPFVCMLVPSDGEYDTHWVTYDAYGEVIDDDAHPPTHWMPITPLPALPAAPKPEEK